MPVYEVSDFLSDEVFGTLTTDAKGVIVSHTMTGDLLMDGAVKMKETLSSLSAHGGPYTTYTEIGGKTPSLVADAIAKARANNARRAQARPREDPASPRQHSDESLVENDTVAPPASNWVTVYDRDARWCTITAFAGRDRGWEYLQRDDAISDPEGRFDVYVGSNGQDVQVRILLNDDGDLAARHPSFNVDLIGSYTLWPYASGDLARSFVWWSEQKSLWEPSRPTEWEHEDS